MNIFTDFDAENLLKFEEFKKKITFGTGKTLKAGDLVVISKYYQDMDNSGTLYEAEYPSSNLMVVEALKMGLDSNYLVIFGHELGCRARLKIVTREDFVKKDLLQTVRFKLEHKTP